MSGECRVAEKEGETCLNKRTGSFDSENTESNIGVLISDQESRKQYENSNSEGDILGEGQMCLNENKTQPEDASEHNDKEARTTSTKVPPKLVPPDGGWGWLVGFGAFINTTLLFSVAPSFGVLFSRFLLDLKTSSTTTAWIFNVQMCIWYVMAPFVMPLCTEFGWRRIGFLGISLVSSAIIISAFAPSAEFLFFSFSTLSGVGGGLASTVCFLILPTYFEKRRGTANTMLFSGICMGQILGSPVIRYLQDEYAFTGAAMLYGAIIFHCSIGVALFHPLKWHLKRAEEPEPETPEDAEEALLATANSDKKDPPGDATPGALTEDMKVKARALRAKKIARLSESSHISNISKVSDNPSLLYASISGLAEMAENTAVKEKSGLWVILKRVCCATIADLRIFTSMRALLINVGIALGANSYFNFVMMVPFRMQEAGFTLKDSAWCISVLGMCNLVCRLIVSPLTDWSKFSMRACFMAGYGIIAVNMFVFPVLTNLTWITVVMGATGCGIAANITLNTLIMIKYMGLEKLPSVFGASCLLIAVTFIVLGPFIGFVRDVTGSYTISIRILSGMTFSSFLLWFLMPAAVAYDAKREAASCKKKQDTQSA